MEATEAKSALSDAMQTLQQTEAKLKAMEENFNQNHLELQRLRTQAAASKKKSSMAEAGTQANSISAEPAGEKAGSCDSKQLSLLEQQVSFLYKISTHRDCLPE